MTTGADLKAWWRRDEVSLGMFVHSTDPAISNVLTHVGLDWLIIDSEHQPFNPETLQTLLLTIRASDTVPVVRVAGNDDVLIKHALDFGAEGVLVPLIHNASEARRAVAACKYPPVGVRGMGGRAVTDFYRKTADYVATANDRTIVMLQIEHIDAVNEIEAIAHVPGVDCLFVGQVDLSASMGLGWQIEHPLVEEATSRVLNAGRQAGIAVGVALDAPPNVVLKWIGRGARVISVGIDWVTMRRAVEENLTAVRQELPQY